MVAGSMYVVRMYLLHVNERQLTECYILASIYSLAVRAIFNVMCTFSLQTGLIPQGESHRLLPTTGFK